MTIRRLNPRKQGEIGLTVAMAWFVEQGWIVLLPLSDNQPYDLVVDGPGGLQRVQVKTTTAKDPRGVYVVGLRTTGGNRSRLTAQQFNAAAVDLLFVLADDRACYLISAEEVGVRNQLTLGQRMQCHRVVGCDTTATPPTIAPAGWDARVAKGNAL